MDLGKNLELTRQVINFLIIALGVLAIGFVLRNVFKLAWRVVRVILFLLGLLIILGQLFGFLRISLL